MRLGRLHVRFTCKRQHHSQSRYPGTQHWTTRYYECDEDLRKPKERTWVTCYESEGSRFINILHREVSRFLMEFEVVYRSFSFNVCNCTQWRY